MWGTWIKLDDFQWVFQGGGMIEWKNEIIFTAPLKPFSASENGNAMLPESSIIEDWGASYVI